MSPKWHRRITGRPVNVFRCPPPWMASLHDRSRFCSLPHSTWYPVIFRVSEQPGPLVRGPLISENFCRKGLNGCAFLPSVQRQTGFAAGLFEESGAVPVVLGWHLGQEQAAVTRHADEQAVTSDFDGLGSNRLRRRQDAELNFQLRRFRQRHRIEARVSEGGRACRVCHGTIYGTHREHITHAPSQLALQVKRRECAPRFREMVSGRIKRDLATFKRREDGVVGQAKQQGAFLL